jgi:aminopeptidase N
MSLRGWVGLLLVGAACAPRTLPPADAPPAFGEPENRPHPERRSDYDVKHYAIDLALDFDERAIHGYVEVTLAPTVESLATVRLDAAEMQILAVTVDGRPASFRHAAGTLAIALPAPAPKDRALVCGVRFTARPTVGLFFILPDAGYPDKPRQAWTQGETEYNRHWFPCYDYPNDRATAELWVTAPAEMTVVSNGLLADTSRFAVSATEALAIRQDGVRGRRPHVPAIPSRAGDYGLWHYVLDEEVPSYLISIAVGEFDIFGAEVWIDGKEIPLRVFVPRGRLDADQVARLFGNTSRMVEFFSRIVGVSYPWRKYDQTLVMDFSWGGMENVTATTLNGDWLISAAQPGADDSTEGLVAHELAHQWFGDWVTCRSWAHLWLNESFATFFEHWWARETQGQAEFEYKIHRDMNATIAQDERYRRPIVNDVYTHPDDMFDTRSYGGGAVMLNQLRHVLGDEPFFYGIHLYVARHGAQSVQTADLQAAMETAAGHELGWFFDQWLHKTMYPEFRVTSVWDPAAKTLQLNVEQTHAVTERRPIFRTPVDIGITTGAGTVVERRTIQNAREQFTFEVKERPVFVDFDAGSWILKKLEFAKSTEELVHQLEKDTDVAGRLWALERLAAKPEARAALERAALSDPFYGVRAEAAGALGDAASIETLEKARRDPDYRVRAAAVRALSRFPAGFDGVLDSARNDSSLPVAAAAAGALGAYKEKGYETLMDLIRSRGKENAVTIGIIEGLTRLQDPRGYDAVAAASLYGRPAWPRQNAVGALARWAEADSRRRPDALRRLVELLTDPDFRTRRAAINALGETGDASVVPALQSRAFAEPEARLRRAARQAIEKIQKPAPGR